MGTGSEPEETRTLERGGACSGTWTTQKHVIELGGDLIRIQVKGHPRERELSTQANLPGHCMALDNHFSPSSIQSLFSQLPQRSLGVLL